jgi:RNA-directed DNA polymerase
MRTFLQGIAKKAREQPRHRFGNLYELLNEEFLKDSWRYIRKDAAYGVDEVSARDYEKNLEENIRNLVGRLKGKRYRAKLVRRRYISKGDGRQRPLGIPATEDKLLQLAVTRILTAIYEQDFLRCSYGYRPEVGALDAVDKLTIKLQFGRYHYVVEADIKGYFDSIDQEWMIRMLEERIEDGAFLGLIKKWLKAGVLDTDGKVIHPATGTPQGGIVSPVLANVYLHYVLDLWFHRVVEKRCEGEACLIRYADDFVCGFQYRQEAERFHRDLRDRLGKFGLELSEEKTRVLEFSKRQQPGKGRFDFLGFEFRWGRDRKGKPQVQRRTSRKKYRASLKRFTEWCRTECRKKARQWVPELNMKLRGYYRYYGVNGNYASLNEFHYHMGRILFKWLNRRSQRRSYNWAGFKELLKHFRLEKPRIYGRPKRALHSRQLRLFCGCECH